MQDLLGIYQIPKMHKNPIRFRFIIASPVCSIKPLPKDITTILKLLYEKVERYHTKGKVWSGIKRKAAKSMHTFDFLTLYTEVPHDKLLYVLNEITDFAFKGKTRDYVTVYNSGAFWSGAKSKTGRSYSLQEIRSCLEFLINNK